jgi:hypothetical protein
LTVLEQNPNNLIGWWLCSLNGRQGIAPQNRLRLMPGIYENDRRKSWNSSNHCSTIKVYIIYSKNKTKLFIYLIN